MELKNLQKHIRTLALLDETPDLVVSCYLNLEEGEAAARQFLAERGRVLQGTLTRSTRPAAEEALAQIETFAMTSLFPDALGAAVFARAGASPFFLPLQFRVPLPNWLAVNATPNIYHLIELKDTYHRYVVLISTETSARILEINLGAVTAELWRQRPELRERVGREWTREHYQNHRRERTHRFIKEKIEIVDRLMRAGGHSHLILAGNPQMTARVRAALPKSLQAKLVDTVVAANTDDMSDVVLSTLAAFVEKEEQESQALVDTLQREIWASGLAVIGVEASRAALQNGQADVLILAKTLPDPATREDLARLAGQHQCQVEVVNQNEWLMNVGGAGCLLRYALPGGYW